MCRKGIILAGGTGSRLMPVTKVMSKQLVHIYDKPMIFYPLTTLMLAGIKDILIITTPEHILNFKSLLGDGKDLGLNFSYKIQRKPNGLAEAFLIGEEFIDNSDVALILGDNLFHGQSFVSQVEKANSQKVGATIFAYQVRDPERYGTIELDKELKPINIVEKPINPKSSFAITGLYFYDRTVVEKAKKIKPSKRGELEITDINNLYLKEKTLKVEIMSRGMAWLDTGTFDALHEAGSYIRTLEHRQGLKVGCPEEVAWRNGWIDDNSLIKLAKPLMGSGYGNYLLQLIDK
jgi:glucose-1-phosphate thymidylyltransferase